MEDKNVGFNMYGGQINYARDNATIWATQYNGATADELDHILQGIISNLSGLEKEDADNIKDIADMAKKELTKPKPKASRLRNCLTLIAPMFTIANGIPTLVTNLQKLQDLISLQIH